MADALASGASVLRDVGVQVPLRPPRAVLRTATHEVTNQKWFVTFVFGGLVVDERRFDEVRDFRR